MPEHSLHIFDELKRRGVPTQVYLHQGGHGGPPPLEMRNRWFTRYLYGIDNGVEDDPRAFVVREGADRGDPTAYADYPNPDSEPVQLYPSAGGAGVGTLTLAGASGGIETFADDVTVSGGELATAEASPHRLLYATAPLSEDVHLSGTPFVRLKLAADAPGTNLSVWLVSLPWVDGEPINANLINRGWADPQNRNVLTESERLRPGEFVNLSFDLQPDDQIIPAGQRIGLMVFGSDQEFTLWARPGIELTLDLAEVSLELPVVGGTEALQRALAGSR
jgi:X-Pro dipeptidyl-peptidase